MKLCHFHPGNHNSHKIQIQCVFATQQEDLVNLFYKCLLSSAYILSCVKLQMSFRCRTHRGKCGNQTPSHVDELKTSKWLPEYVPKYSSQRDLCKASQCGSFHSILTIWKGLCILSYLKKLLLWKSTHWCKWQNCKDLKKTKQTTILDIRLSFQIWWGCFGKQSKPLFMQQNEQGNCLFCALS